MKLYKINQFCEAKSFVNGLGLRYDRVIQYRKNVWMAVLEKNPIYYFMIGSCDIAYYIEGMNTLLIHNEPRQWDKNILEQYTDKI